MRVICDCWISQTGQDRTHAPQNTAARQPSSADPLAATLALPRAPHRRRYPRLATCDVVRPDHDLFAVLPLAGDELMSDLVPAVIHREVADDSLRLERE